MNIISAVLGFIKKKELSLYKYNIIELEKVSEPKSLDDLTGIKKYVYRLAMVCHSKHHLITNLVFALMTSITVLTGKVFLACNDERYAIRDYA